MTPLALEAKQLTCRYERWGQTVLALDRVSLEVPVGQWIVLAGHNGAGKSTLLRLISGKVSDFSGEVRVGKRSLRQMSPREWSSLIYYVQQDPTLGSAPLLTVFENLLIADPQAARTRRQVLEDRYRALLAEAGLEARLHHPAHYLSGGERQLLAFLIARIRPASVVLLDEALAALDASRVSLCLRLIAQFREEAKTLVFVTHSVETAATVGDRTLVLRDGRIVYDRSGSARKAEEIRSLISWAEVSQETEGAE